MGDEAILISELLSLREQINEVEFYILSFNPERTKRLTARIPEVKKILRVGSKQHVIKSDFLGILKTLREVDTVVIGGGGIFQDIYNFYPIPFFTLLALLASFNRKQSVLYNVGIGPVNTFIGRKLCRIAANSVDMISVRDSESRDLLLELGVSKKIYLSADPVFLLEPVRNEKVNEVIKANNLESNGPVICVCVQELLYWSESDRKILADVLDILSVERGVKIVFLPLGAYKDGWFSNRASDTVDMAATKKLISMMAEKPSVITDELTPQELLAVMERMDIVISMRLHGLIMGLTSSTPVIALTYREESKIRSLMKRLDQEASLFDVCKLEKWKLLNRIDYLLSRAAEVKRNLLEMVSAIQAEAEKCNEILINTLIHNTAIEHHKKKAANYRIL